MDFTRQELQNIQQRAVQGHENSENPFWKAAYCRVATAVNTLDALIARSEEHEDPLSDDIIVKINNKYGKGFTGIVPPIEKYVTGFKDTNDKANNNLRRIKDGVVSIIFDEGNEEFSFCHKFDGQKKSKDEDFRNGFNSRKGALIGSYMGFKEFMDKNT
jgi:hypothetical protein